MKREDAKYLNISLALALLLISIVLPYLHNHTTLDEDISCPAYIYVHSFSGEIISTDSGIGPPEQPSQYLSLHNYLSVIKTYVARHTSRAPPFAMVV